MIKLRDVGVLIDKVVSTLLLCVFLATQDTGEISSLVPKCKLFYGVFFEVYWNSVIASNLHIFALDGTATWA